MSKYNSRFTIYDLGLRNKRNQRHQRAKFRSFVFHLPSPIFLLLSSIFLVPFIGNAQHTIFLDGEEHSKIEQFLNDSDFNSVRCFHSEVKPYLDVDVQSIKVAARPKTHVFDVTPAPIFISYPIKRLNWKTYYDKNGDQYYGWKGGEHQNGFLIRPVYDLIIGQDLKAKKLIYTGAAGAVLDADYKQKLGLEVRFVTGTAVLPGYSDSIAHYSGMMPGWGDRAYPNGNGSYSFQHLSGNLIYRPSRVFNIQVGRDKHFWGDGYRSLFLSDVGAAMPCLKMQTTIWKLQYTSLFTWMQDWTNSTGSAKDFRSKFGTFHYISFNAAKWLNLGVFESIIFQGKDNNRFRGFDPDYLNPIIFYRPVEFSLGSSDNAMLGFSFRIRFNANNQLYAQLLLDEFYLKEIKNWKMGWWGNKQGVQMGYRIFNMGSVRNLNLQMEMNVVRPYTYSHGSAQQNYSNAGMPLAHPLGANFAEMLGILSYSYKGFSVAGKLVAARYGLDYNGSDYGQNIFISYIDRTSMIPNQPTQRDYNHHLFDGAHTNLFYAELKTAYRFNTAFPLRIELLAGARSEHNFMVSKKTSYVQIGLSLPLWKSYRDY